MTRAVTVIRVLFVAGALAHLVLVVGQPFLAGWSLDGNGAALELHGINGSIIITISMILIPLSVLSWRPGRGTGWGPALAVLLFAAESLQTGAGYAGVLVVHVPLGVGIVFGSAVLLALAVKQRHTSAPDREARP